MRTAFSLLANLMLNTDPKAALSFLSARTLLQPSASHRPADRACVRTFRTTGTISRYSESGEKPRAS